ncbi:hypothetical protein [Falsiroseomonas sp. E2-1-a20]|uniref:hypothetical protein n=1 Tax=Falsiroseomonas sp. E2-1-a20 TaxID=3239300 RepID=UPI003F3E194A
MKARSDFPAVKVVYRGEILHELTVDLAFALARQDLRAARGRADPDEALAIFASHVPAAIEQERQRVARWELPPVMAPGVGPKIYGMRYLGGLPRDLERVVLP